MHIPQKRLKKATRMISLGLVAMGASVASNLYFLYSDHWVRSAFVGMILVCLVQLPLYVGFCRTCFHEVKGKPLPFHYWGFGGITFGLLANFIIAFATMYRVLGIVAPGGSPEHGVGACLYFSVITWTTVGYGDFVPTPAARTVAACEAFAGYIFMAVAVSTLLYLLTQRDPQKAPIPSRVRERVNRQYHSAPRGK